MRYVRAFGAFWYDFLVGDRPELFVGPVLGLTLAWIVARSGAGDLVSGTVLVAATCAVGLVSLLLVLRPRR